MHPRLHTTLTLAALAALGPLSLDALLPAMPALGREFGMSLVATQHSVTWFMAALASSHLLSAWASNVVGKRAVLLAGAIALGAGSALCALATGTGTFSGGRLLQGLGAGTVAAQLPLLLRLSRDSPQVMAFAALPVLAPALGAALALSTTWRHISWLAAAVALLAVGLVAVAPAAAGKQREEFQFDGLLPNVAFLRYTACHALCFGALMAGMACLPILVTMDLGLGPGRIALLLAAGATALFVCASANGHTDPGQSVAGGLILSLFGAVGIAIWETIENDVNPFNYLLGSWTLLCAGFGCCAKPLAAGALKASGEQARAGLALLQFASHACAAAAILLTTTGRVDSTAITTFGCAALMIIAGGLLLPPFIWRSLSSQR